VKNQILLCYYKLSHNVVGSSSLLLLAQGKNLRILKELEEEGRRNSLASGCCWSAAPSWLCESSL